VALGHHIARPFILDLPREPAGPCPSSEHLAQLAA